MWDADIKVAFTRMPGTEDLPPPSYLTDGAAGADLCAACHEPITVPPGEARLIPTGLQLAIPPGFEAQVRPRSGLALRHAVTVLNSPGTIDADYRGEIGVILINHGREPFTVKRGDRIAQLVFQRALRSFRWRPAPDSMLNHDDAMP